MVDRPIDGFNMFHRDSDGILRSVFVVYDLLDGDKLQISSVSGSKHVTLTRGGVESFVLYALSSQSAWIQLTPGDNHLRVHIPGEPPIPFSIEYTRQYGGL